MVHKYAFELISALGNISSYFRLANDNDGTMNYGEYPENVLKLKAEYTEAHHVIADVAEDGDFSLAQKALDNLSPFDKFDVWDTPTDYITDLMHPIHIMQLYKMYLLDELYGDLVDAINYFGSFEEWIADEIYWRANECELDFFTEDCTRYVKRCINLAPKYMWSIYEL